LNANVWLIGAGEMAIDYAKVLQAQNVAFDVCGRGAKSAKNFNEKTGVPVHQGGLQSWLDRGPSVPSAAIVAVNVEQLAETTLSLLRYGVRRVLVEQTAGLDLEDINLVANEAGKKAAEVYVAYNRRFYASVLEAQEMIASDGGVISFTFEFTEWSHVIAGLDTNPRVKEHWFLANSTHVIDLAFYLGGRPKELISYTTGGLSWHPSASVFTGAGITEKGALFSYHANWESPGRWGVEILTRKHRFIFRPLEKLQVQRLGSVVIEEVKVDDELDQKYKPGLFLQVKAFVTGKNSEKLDLITSHRDLASECFSKIIHPRNND
jgi:predicted dehydrogenase